MDTLGVKSIDEIKGRKCHELLQGSIIPCGLCTNNQLSVGNYVEWRYYNQVIDRHLMVKDTMIEDPDSGKKYHLEIAIDVTDDTTKETAEDVAVKIYQDMEMLVNRGMKEAISAESPDESIKIILEEKIETLDAQIAANATNSVKLRELMEKKEETENALDEKMDRWVYLNDLNEKIQDAKQQG